MTSGLSKRGTLSRYHSAGLQQSQPEAPPLLPPQEDSGLVGHFLGPYSQTQS